MDIIPTKTPKSVKLLFPNYTWDFYGFAHKKIYLTFDDGPIPDITEFVLDELKKYNAKATFFCIGDNIRKHPEIFNSILAQNHSIGNHTMHHLKAWKNDKKTYLQNVLKCETEIQKHKAAGNSLKLFRPPYGQISVIKLKQLKQLGYSIILWDVLAKDWRQDITPQKCVDTIIKNTKPGSIIVLHDSIKAFKNTKVILPTILEHYTNQGFTFESISKRTLSSNQ